MLTIHVSRGCFARHVFQVLVNCEMFLFLAGFATAFHECLRIERVVNKTYIAGDECDNGFSGQYFLLNLKY